MKLFVLLLGICFSTAFANIETVNIEPKKLYKKNCGICHGSKGGLGIGGATNLKTSELSVNQAIKVIAEGRGAMTPFSEILSKKEIKSLAKYIQTLKN